MPLKSKEYKGKYAHLGLGPMEVRVGGIHKSSPFRLYRIWVNMKARSLKCPSVMKQHPAYLDLDTSMCEEWRDFGNFWRWAISHGYRDDLSIDRIDNFKGYNPDNCRWATPSEQSKNRRMTPRRLASCMSNLVKANAAKRAALKAGRKINHG